MTEQLPLESVIGFGGDVQGGLLLHPDGNTIIYPLGSTVVVRSKDNPKSQEFLQGHTDQVSCVAMSKSGRYLASGQITYMGFTADIIIWDLASRTPIHKLSLHKVKVQALDFSPDDKYLASLGGEDDNAMVIWDVESGQAVCGTPTDKDHTLQLKFLSQTSLKLVTGGNYNLNIWTFDPETRKLKPQSVELSKLKRVFTSLAVDAYDQYVYCGTASGDVLQVALDQAMFKNSGPAQRVSKGISSLAVTPSGDLLIGGGDGSLLVMKQPNESTPQGKMKVLCSTNVGSAISSIVIAAAGPHGAFSAIAGTEKCDMYDILCDGGKIGASVFQTCHYEKINDVCFPVGYSELFATCSGDNIRVWHLSECRELLRITVPNLECNCIIFTADGKAILSGWSDGKIRCFGPQSGKLLWMINDAHQQGVTAIAGSADCTRCISGGKEGMVRVWRLGKQSQSMIASMKEHKGPVNSITLKKDDSQCVSASSDGSCIIWDLKRFARNQSLFASSFFKDVVYHPDESQLLTTGTDRKLTYWDAFDGQAIRILDGSETHECAAIGITPDGEAYASGGGDKLVKFWSYDEGHCYYIGKGHSGSITNIKVSPDQKKIISVGSEGAIFIWENPGLPSMI